MGTGFGGLMRLVGVLGNTGIPLGLQPGVEFRREAGFHAGQRGIVGEVKGPRRVPDTVAFNSTIGSNGNAEVTQGPVPVSSKIAKTMVRIVIRMAGCGVEPLFQTFRQPACHGFP